MARDVRFLMLRTACFHEPDPFREPERGDRSSGEPVRAVAVRVIMACALVVCCATGARADDRDLLRAGSVAPNVLVLVDTSDAMQCAPSAEVVQASPSSGLQCLMLPGGGDDPASRIGIVKRALQGLLADDDGVNIALAAFEQREIVSDRPIAAKHWVYEALDHDRFGMVTPGYAYRLGPGTDASGALLTDPSRALEHALIGYEVAVPAGTPAEARYGPVPASAAPGGDDRAVDTLPIYFGQCVELDDGPICVPGVFPVTTRASDGGGVELATWTTSFVPCPADRAARLQKDPAACDGYCRIDPGTPGSCAADWEVPASGGSVIEWQRRAQLRLVDGQTPLAETPAGQPTGNLHIADIGLEDYDLDGVPDPDVDGDEQWDWVLEAELIEQRRYRKCSGTPRACGPWRAGDGSVGIGTGSSAGFDESWAAGGASRDLIRFKLDIEAALSDPRISSDDPRLDLRLDPGRPCSGWRLLADLPDPVAGGDRALVDELISPMAEAVRWVDNGTSTRFRPARPSRRATPLIPWGAAAIERSLLEARDWYLGQRGEGGAWADDPQQACRRWTMVLLAGSLEGCGGDACKNGGIAEQLARPIDGVPGLPVNVVALTDSGAGAEAVPPGLACLADQGRGRALTVQTAAGLEAALRRIVRPAAEDPHAFVPLVVAPSPVTAASPDAAGRWLVVAPELVPVNGSSLWEGHLRAFEIAADNPQLPIGADGQLDRDQAVWDAANGIPPAAARQVFTSEIRSGSFRRLRLEVTPGGDLEPPASENPARAQLLELADLDESLLDRVVTTVRSARLGDIFHSTPVVVGPPADPVYLYAGPGDEGLAGYADFVEQNAGRRRVVLAGANDGMLHAFDAGGGATGGAGSGKELFAYVPRAVVPRLGDLALSSRHQYMVDGPITVADVRIGVTAADGSDAGRQWRTVALVSQRRGGRGLTALDVTQPDPPNTSSPGSVPGCLDRGSGCSYGLEYPRVLWELEDLDDEDSSGAGCTGSGCAAAAADLGWTWSRPAVVRVRRADPVDPARSDELFVAFLGGGRGGEDGVPAEATGRHLYGIEIASGRIIYKAPIGAPVPGGVEALDADGDGFADRLYFGDERGGLWRLDVSSPAQLTDGRVSGWNLTRIYQLGPGSGIEPIAFFTAPRIVPAASGENGPVWALALGSGDRDRITRRDAVLNRFYYVVDPGDTTTRGEDQLTLIDATAAGDGPGGQCAVDRPGSFGWALVLRDGEKVIDDAMVAGVISFSTYQPTGLVSSPSPSTPGPGGGGADCGPAGISRVYTVYACNAEPYGEERSEVRDAVTWRSEAWLVGDRIVLLDRDAEGGVRERELSFGRSRRVSNWRQD